MDAVKRHQDLTVYRAAFDAAMRLFEFSKRFPVEERYSLTDQMQRASRSVCANLAEAWRLRRYAAAFASKICDCEREAAETQTWIEFAVRCNYLPRDAGASLYREYDAILASLVGIRTHLDSWLLPAPAKR